MAKFEKVSRFADVKINMPVRKTKRSAGYDFEVAEDIVIPSYLELRNLMSCNCIPNSDGKVVDKIDALMQGYTDPQYCELDYLSLLTKKVKAKPSLVSTGMKCKLADDEYLELSIRSSCPLKYWIILANGVGIIDSDYYNNPDNEGEIFFQVINISPYPIHLKVGDIIGQGIIHKYIITEDDVAKGERLGGFGSTTKEA